MESTDGINSISDIAKELCRRYFDIKDYLVEKGEKGKAFKKILNSLFIEYGSKFGFEENPSAFRSSVIRAKNSLKKHFKREDVYEYEENKYDEEDPLLRQIEELNLNYDTYF